MNDLDKITTNRKASVVSRTHIHLACHGDKSLYGNLNGLINKFIQQLM